MNNVAPSKASSAQLPRIIQGGMGVGISGWELANAVARQGALGVVSGTVLEVVMARRLQLGDPGGHMRRALEHFPFPAVAARIVDAYFIDGGKAESQAFKKVRTFTITPDLALQELTVAANFAEVFLAKEGHDGQVGINYLRKIELPIPCSLYGAMLAGVDYVIVGAGNPKDIPGLIQRLARHEPVSLAVRVQGVTSADGEFTMDFDPTDIHRGEPPPISRPAFLAIVASVDLAAGLAAMEPPPDGFIVEAPSAGGHNAPPRGPRRVVDFDKLREIGLPFWLAGSMGSPEGLRQARDAGAIGVQVGTAFAFCAESGLDPDLKRQVLAELAAGELDVHSDWRASPTGFPFRILQLKGTLSDEQVYDERRRVCDLGALRVPYKTEEGSIGYRCPAEPLRAYTDIKGGRVANTEGRLCLCNGLLATAGLGQHRVASDYDEPALITAGSDFRGVRALMDRMDSDAEFYTATDVLGYLRGARQPV